VPSHSELDEAYLSIEQAARLLRNREISPVELVDSALERIERGNAGLNAFVTVLADRARREARIAERAFRHGRPRSPLHGIPISLKDNFCTRGIRTTAGSKILADFVPEKDSEVARLLAKAGAILLGKTNMHEFSMGSRARTRIMVRCAIRGRAIAFPAVRVEDRRRLWRRECASLRLGQTREVRFAFRRRSAESLD